MQSFALSFTPNFSTAGFTWGDPHFESVDGKSFTFNGLGEYTLLEAAMNKLYIQVRLTRYLNTNGTVLSAVTMKNGDSQRVQVEASSSPGADQLLLYTNGVEHSIPSNQGILLVTESEVLTEQLLRTVNVDTTEEDTILLRNNNNTLLLTTPSQVIFSVARQQSFLYAILQLGPTFGATTRGLLGTYNNDPEDDFQRPDGSTIPSTSSEQTIFSDFGLKCKQPSISYCYYQYYYMPTKI